jgi:ferredoxin
MKEKQMENRIELRTPVDFEVDSSVCLRCGACVRDCAFKVLSFDRTGLPSMPHPEKCMRCQHCFAVCPVGAITFDGVKSTDVAAVKDLELPNADQIANWIRSRRSIRKFAAEDVDPVVLDNVLKLLANSPTGCNARSLKFTCFPDRKSMDALRKKFISVIEKHRNGTKLLPRWLAVPAIQLRRGVSDVFFRGATGLLIVSSDKNAPGVTTPNEDVVIACSHFDMLAQANGLGTCWFGFFKHIQEEVPEILPELVGIDETTPFYAILFGYPGTAYKRCVRRDDEAEIEWRNGL